ncbi:hypothetical protein Ga0466249_005051 [Sporomusaceae bacterium BoRhaA]|nr:hypothetical protein [Pelorhabdus rhamnosifermentans]
MAELLKCSLVIAKIANILVHVIKTDEARDILIKIA